MKKRSLVVATAMLLVAILAASGATYAWFTRSTTATLGTLTMGVESATGLAISLDSASATKKSNLSQSDLESDTTNNTIVDSLLDVSATLAGVKAGTFFKSTNTLANGDPEGYEAADATADYTTFKFRLWNLDKNQAKNVTVTGSIANATGADIAKVCRVALKDTAQTPTAYIYDTSGETCDAINAAAGTEVSTAATNIATGTTAAFNIPANGYITLVGYVWAEGTDAQCDNNSVTFGDINVNLTFTAAVAP